MRAPAKLVLGAASFYPLVVWLTLMGSLVAAFAATAYGQRPNGPPSWSVGVLGIHLITVICLIALEVFYIRDAYRNPGVAGGRRGLWAVVLLMGNVVAMPIYWYLYIWKQEPAGPGQRVESRRGNQ